MKTTKPTQLTATLLALSCAMASSALAFPHGGGSTGGGDPLALEFKATAEVALKNLQALKGAPFTGVNIAQLQSKIESAQVLVSDQPLPVPKDGITQDSTAENRPSQNLIVLNRADYMKIGSAAVQQALALHEFLSLDGAESTGNYPVSSQYLIAEGGAASTDAQGAIVSATKSVVAQTPCPEPNPDASTLFSMIMDAGTPVSAVQSFIQTHVVAWDALNDQCETTFDVAIDQNRQDIFQALFGQYHPDLSAPEPQASTSAQEFSIYSHVLGHGSVALLTFLRTEASSAQQKLSLAPLVGSQSGQYPVGTTELMMASWSNPSVEMIQLLIREGASVNAADSNRVTALMYAATDNTNVDVIRALIQAGASVNAANSRGVTPLMYAAADNTNVDVIRALIQAGASVNAADSNGMTALMNAAADNTTNVDVIRALIQAGASVNAANSRGVTPLMYAAADNTNVDVIRALIQAGAGVNAADSADSADSKGVTPLMYAAADNTNVDVIRALIQSGASVNAADSNGMTALMYAAFPFGSTGGLYGGIYQEALQDQIIQTLIQAGADLTLALKYSLPESISDVSGDTALQIAQHHDAPESILKLLGGS